MGRCCAPGSSHTVHTMCARTRAAAAEAGQLGTGTECSPGPPTHPVWGLTRATTAYNTRPVTFSSSLTSNSCSTQRPVAIHGWIWCAKCKSQCLEHRFTNNCNTCHIHRFLMPVHRTGSPRGIAEDGYNLHTDVVFVYICVH